MRGRDSSRSSNARSTEENGSRDPPLDPHREIEPIDRRRALEVGDGSVGIIGPMELGRSASQDEFHRLPAGQGVSAEERFETECAPAILFSLQRRSRNHERDVGAIPKSPRRRGDYHKTGQPELRSPGSGDRALRSGPGALNGPSREPAADQP